MTSRQWLFKSLYRFGFVPWDGHPLRKSPTDRVEGDGPNPPLTAGKALDVGCGTGDNSIYLAKHGWQVTGLDYVPEAVDRAREAVSPWTTTTKTRPSTTSFSARRRARRRRAGSPSTPGCVGVRRRRRT